MTPNHKLCPYQLVKSFTAYRDLGIPPGNFVRACLENDFVQACLRADNINNETLPHIAAWLWMNMPGNIWDSRERVVEHLSAMADRVRELQAERDEPIVYERGELPPPDTRTEHDRTL